MFHQGELFSVLGRAIPKLRAPAAKPSYAKIKPVHRTLCGDCTSEIHRLGIGRAPFPRPARWRRTHLGESLLLCNLHKEARVDRGD